DDQTLFLRAQHEFASGKAAGSKNQHFAGDFFVAARVVVAEAQVFVLDLPAARDLFKRGDLSETPQLHGWIAAPIEQLFDDALVQGVARAWQTAEETPALALAIRLTIEGSLLGIGVFDNREVQRSPFLGDLVFRGESRVARELLAGLFQVSDLAEVGES